MVSKYKYLYSLLYIASALTTYKGLTTYSLEETSSLVYLIVIVSLSLLFVVSICLIEEKWYDVWKKSGFFLKIALFIAMIFLITTIFICSTLYSIVNISGVNPTLENMSEITNQVSQLPLKINQRIERIESFHRQLKVYSKSAHKRANNEKAELNEGPHYEANMFLAKKTKEYSILFRDIYEKNNKTLKYINSSIEELSKYRIWIYDSKNNIITKQNLSEFSTHNKQERISYTQLCHKFTTILNKIKRYLGQIRFTISPAIVNEINSDIEECLKTIPTKEEARYKVRNHDLKKQEKYLRRIQKTKYECKKMLNTLNYLKEDKQNTPFLKQILSLDIQLPRKLIFLYPDPKAFGLGIALDFGPLLLALFISISNRKEDDDYVIQYNK